MDFVEWCGIVLTKLIEAGQASSDARSYGVADTALARTLFGEALVSGPAYHGSPQHMGLALALRELETVGFAATPGDPFWCATPDGRRLASDPTPLWGHICSAELEPEQEQLLRLINRLTEKTADTYAWLEDALVPSLVTEHGWQDEGFLRRTAQELKEEGLLGYGAYRLRATYRGLVWDTRRAYTVQSNFIDRLVAAWENTSVDFKREVRTNTADDKAEFVKDILALANTQSPGQRWLVIGFDDRTRAYHGPPDPKLTQNHIEQLLAQYTAPLVEVRYEVVAYRAGPVGLLEVLRDRAKVPYGVAKSIGDRRRITQGQIFVRHGSQVEPPSPAELQALQEEGDRAREALR